MGIADLAKSLPKLPVVTDGLSEQDLARLDTITSTIGLEPQAYLFHQHSVARSCYIVATGELMIERSSAAGKRQIVAFICPGNFIGFTGNDYYEFSVQALTQATLFELPMRQFSDMADDIPQLKRNVRHISGNVLAHTMDTVFALGQKKAHERVCFFLRQLLERDSNTPRQITLTMTRQDIADYLGLTIETVSRAFARLKSEGVIDIHSAHVIEVFDMDTVEEYALSE